MIITVSHSKGGVSKSTIIMHLLGLLQDQAVVIDTDLQQSAFKLNSFRKKPLNIFTATNESELFELLDTYENKTILIDTAGIDSTLNRLCIANSDICLVPVKDNSLEILEIVSYEKVLTEIKLQSPVKCFALLSNIHHSTKNFGRLEGFVSDSKTLGMFDTILRTRSDFPNTLDAGTTVTEANKNSKASKEIIQLWKELQKNG